MLITWKNLVYTKIRQQKGTENLVANHLSRLEGPNKEVQINDDFLDKQLLEIEDIRLVPWFTDYVNYLVAKVIPPEFSYQQKNRFFAHLKHYYWEVSIMYKHCADQVIRRCVPEEEMESILNQFHTLDCGGHFEGQRTTAEVLQSGFY